MRRVMIALLTRGRPLLLEECVSSLVRLDIPQGIELSLLVVDNNDQPEAKTRLEAMLEEAPFSARCVWEPRRGIVLARNRALQESLEAGQDDIAFIDDDETVSADWLKAMLAQRERTGADIVTGPVASILPSEAPAWLSRISLFQPRRERPKDGLISSPAYTNNVLFSLQIVRQHDLWFDEAYNRTGGSDVVFFRRAQQLGYRTAWVQTCHVRERIPSSRAKLSWILRRRFRHGQQRLMTSESTREGASLRFLLMLRALASILGGLLACPLCAPLGLHKALDALGVTADGLGTLAAFLKIRLEDYQEIHGA